jgi:hypothetical protein
MSAVENKQLMQYIFSALPKVREITESPDTELVTGALGG